LSCPSALPWEPLESSLSDPPEALPEPPPEEPDPDPPEERSPPEEEELELLDEEEELRGAVLDEEASLLMPIRDSTSLVTQEGVAVARST
jgi:hypothetical protein